MVLCHAVGMTVSATTLQTFSLLAPAKINLFLHITGKRDDGFHLLQSLMVFVDVGDELTFAPYDGLFLDIDGPFASDLNVAPHDNLIYKAARLLADEYRVPAKARISLRKNLPVASGVAGGSSDAATALRGLVRLWRLPEENERLQKIARQLGADVPACLAHKPVWAEGIGEKMTWMPHLPQFHMVMVNPIVPTPTPEVFRRFGARFSPPLQYSGRRKSMQEWIADLSRYRNDLSDAARTVTPQIADVLRAIEATPNCHFARLSGSGATCFGIYDSPAAVHAAVNKLRASYPDWWVSAASLLP